MFNCAVDSVLGAELFFNEDFVPNFGGAASGQSMQPGLVATLGYAVRGLGWFVRVHPFYFVIYSLFCLAVWAVAGGAICRIAAVHATQDEKIPIREALRFAQAKFAHFFSAPLLPVLFIIGCCIPLVLAGLVGLIPGLGQLIVGVLFVILLAIGFVLALIIIGALGGLGLMYPTIAVEGSDAFDAFSRSYNYVYARPWRTISYTLITAVYGTLCFVFVKLLAGLIFSATSLIVGVTMNWVGAAYASPFGKLQAMWFQASDGPFFGRFYLFPLSAMEGLGSFFIAFWVFLLVGLVVAFAVSFFFCGYTVIYLLLRQRVDATELDDVFIEELESEAALPGEAGAVPSTEESSVPEQPSAEESAGGQGETS